MGILQWLVGLSIGGLLFLVSRYFLAELPIWKKEMAAFNAGTTKYLPPKPRFFSLD